MQKTGHLISKKISIISVSDEIMLSKAIRYLHFQTAKVQKQRFNSRPVNFFLLLINPNGPKLPLIWHCPEKGSPRFKTVPYVIRY